MEPFEVFEHAGCTIELHYDEDPMPPSDWDTLGTVYAMTRDAEWGGFEPPSETHGSAIEAMERGGAALLRRYLRLCYGVHAVAVQVNDYGSLSADDGSDDDGDYYNAYMAATPESVEMTGVPVDRIEEGLRAELDEWRAYFAGEVVGYVVKAGVYVPPEDGIDVYRADERYRATLDVIGSCWGFYPDSRPIEPGENATNSYRLAWELTDYATRPYVYALAEAIDEAEHEQAERQRVANQDIATRLPS